MFQPIGLPAARVVSRLAPRKDRDEQRAKREAEAVRRGGGSAMDAALAAVAAIGLHNEACRINQLKLRVDHVIALGAGHHAVRARYGARAWKLRNQSIDGAIALVEHWYVEEQRKNGSRLSVMVLSELRLILRLIRRSTMRGHFPAIVQFVLGSEPEAFEAAE